MNPSHALAWSSSPFHPLVARLAYILPYGLFASPSFSMLRGGRFLGFHIQPLFLDMLKNLVDLVAEALPEFSAGLHFVAYPPVDLGPGVIVGDPDGVLDRHRVRPSVGDNTDPIEAEEKRRTGTGPRNEADYEEVRRAKEQAQSKARLLRIAGLKP